MLVIERSLSIRIRKSATLFIQKNINRKERFQKEELNNELEIKKLFDPDTECDFYYPDMVLK